MNFPSPPLNMVMEKSHVSGKAGMCKKTYDVTHNANFERVILINVTDITL